MQSENIKICPVCGEHNLPASLRCRCGAILSGVDLSEKPAAVSTAAEPATARPAAALPSAEQGILCPYQDCGQPNPPGSRLCLYCNRELLLSAPAPANSSASAASPGSAALPAPATTDGLFEAGAPTLEIGSLLKLPTALQQRFQLVRVLPAAGAEADILLLQRLSDDSQWVLKLYRSGLRMKASVQERLRRVPADHLVQVLESGSQDGHYYEVLEYCRHGSLQALLQQHKPAPERLEQILRELTTALASIHQAGLLHRDLKPANVLVRSLEPLDLVLTDFGSSSVSDATQRLTGTARTLQYSAPESLSGVIDRKADYWALGMILLEALTGRHPFSGLSEAVMLHHLTTREVDLSGVAEPRWLKLLRGLFVRNPLQRWADSEILRWLAHDDSLPEAPAGIGPNQFREPYHVGDDICISREQLGVSLARHWHDGCTDIINGQLLAWFRDVQKDQNAVRLLLAMRHERKLSPDQQLLALILYLSPGLPPVWKGESIELPPLLQAANRALKGDPAAAAWLHEIYAQNVLEVYRDAGDDVCASVVKRWTSEARAFQQSWQSTVDFLRQNASRRLAGASVNIDQLLYGTDQLNAPPMMRVHAQLLAVAYDPKWAERLRRYISQSYAGVMAYAPWLTELGDVGAMSPSMLLVMDALLPEARNIAEKQKQHQELQQQNAKDDYYRLKRQLITANGSLRAASSRFLMFGTALDQLKQQVDELFVLIAEIRASSEVSEAWLELKKQAVKAERVCLRINTLHDEIAERITQNQGWFSRETAAVVFTALVLLPIILRRNVFSVVAIIVALLAIWRILPIYLNIRRIRSLAELL